MNEQTRVLIAIERLDGQADLLEVCESTGLWAADAILTLDQLIGAGQVSRVGQLYRLTADRPFASVDSVIARHMSRAGKGWR